MRRALIRALGGALLFAAAALAGAGLSSRIAPRELHAAVEASLSEALGTPVTISGARLLVSKPRLLGIPEITVEATGLEAFGSGEGAALRAGHLAAPLDPTSLFSGRLRFSSAALEDVRLELVRQADGRFEPPILTPGFESPVVVLGRLFAGALPVPVLEVRSGALVLVDRGAPMDGAPRRFALESLTVKLLATGLLQTGRLVVSGLLRETKRDPTRFEIESVASGDGLPSFQMAVEGFALERALPYLAADRPGLSLEGRVTGVLGVRQPSDGTTALDLDVRVAGLGGRLDAEALHVPEALSLVGSIAFADDAVRLDPGAVLRAGGLELGLEGRLELPADEDAALSFAASLPSLDREGLAWIARWLPERARGALEEAGRTLRQGRLADLTLAGATSPGAVQEVLAGEGPLLPAGVRFGARLLEIALDPERDAPVVATAGLARLEGPDTLVVTGLEGRVGNEPLPVLDLRLTGVGHLLAAPSAPVGEAPPLPGLRVLQELLAPDDPAAEPPAWSGLALEADWILHPIFFRPLHRIRAHLEPTPHGVKLRVAEAFWGGIPIRGEGVLESGAPGRARLEIDVGEAEPMPPPPAADAVARGRIRFERPSKPGLYAHAIDAGFDLSGSRLSLSDVTGDLHAPGRLGGDAQLELGREGEVGAEIHVTLADALVADVLASLSDDPVEASGSIDLSARLTGPLRPDTRALRTLSGSVRVTAKDGALGIDLPVLLAIAKASTTFNPFGSARGIRFDEIDAELALENGVLSTKRSITVESPDLRLVLSGQVDLREKPSRLEAVVGCFFFRPLDEVIGLIPVVSRIVLGPDRSLFGTYFELTGSWESPTAGLIPMKTLALGPASFLLEDVPAFVQRGVEAVGEALSGPRLSPPAVASPADAATPDGDGS